MTAKIGAILLVVLAVLSAVFVGLGFGVGALSVAAQVTSTQTTNQYSTTTTCSPANAQTSPQTTYEGWCMTVTMPSIAQTGETPVSAMLAGGKSTDILFEYQILNNLGTCNPGVQICYSAQMFAAANGLSGDQVGFVVTFQNLGGTFLPFNSMVNGHPYSTSSGPGPFSGVPAVFYPINGTFATGAHTVPSSNPASPSVTLNLLGIMPVGTLTAWFYQSGHDCNYNGVGGSPNDCNSAYVPTGTSVADQSGAATYQAYASVLVQSGQASIEPLSPPGGLTWNNGPPITVSVTTGYDGAAGYAVEVLIPGPRPNGGSPDPSFPTQSVPNFVVGKSISWSIPNGTGQNSTIAGWNQFEVVLVAQYLDESSVPIAVDVSQQYAPTTPAITFKSSGPFLYPRVSDTLTLTITASSTQTSGAVTGMAIKVFWMMPSDNLWSIPPCTQMQTPGCPNWYQLPSSDLKSSGNTLTATYSFVVDPTLGADAIGVYAQANTAQQQLSQESMQEIQIASTSCIIGDPGCPTNLQVSMWQIGGLILLSLIIVVAVAAVMFLAPVPPFYRYGLIALAAVIVLILYFSGVTPMMFQPGGIFNPGNLGG